MEKFKINSQELISAAGGNEDIFNAINSPANHVFSIQRFAGSDTVSLRKTNGTTTLLADSLLGNILTPYTLGRSSDPSQLTATIQYSANTSIKPQDNIDATFAIAPLVSIAKQDGSSVSTYTDIFDATYKIVGYQYDSSTVRFAIQYDGLPYHTETSQGKGVNPWIGFAVTGNDVYRKVTYDAYFVGSQYNNSRNETFSEMSLYSPTVLSGDGTIWHISNNGYSGVYVSTSYYSSTYLSNAEANGLSYGLLASDTKGTTYTFDLYDVRNSGTGVTSDGVILGKYVFKDETGAKDIDFGKSGGQAVTFDNVDKNETESYTINGVNVSVIGYGTDSNTNVASMTVPAYATTGKQTFSGIGVSSNVSIAFTLAGANSELKLNNADYAVGTDQTGTVTFGATADYNTIDLGSATFNVTAGTDYVYGLTNGATGTFTGTSFKLDLDGKEAGADYNPMSFTATAGATVLGINGDTNLTLNGTFTEISGTNLTSLGYVLSDTGNASAPTSAVFGGLKFTDVAGDGSNTVITFTNLTDVQISGVFSVASGTGSTYDKVPVSSQFKLSDGGVVTFGEGTSAITFSDTKGDSNQATILFGAATSNITLTNSMSATGTFDNTLFTLSTNNDFVINGTTFNAKAAVQEGQEEKNKLQFIQETLIAPDTHGTPAASLNVSGTSMGENITMLGNIGIAANGAYLYNNIYFGNADASNSATVTFGATNSEITVAGNAALEFSAVGTDANSRTLVGLSGQSFTTTSVGGTFYLADSGTAVGINALQFAESVSDGYVTKLVYEGAASSMGIFGTVALTGSDASMVYTLGGFAADSNSSIAINGIQFSGSNTGVQNTAVNAYSLSNSGTGVFSITGNNVAASSYTMVTNAANSFLFGADSTTGIVFAGSDGAVFSGATAVFDTAGAFDDGTLSKSEINFGDGKLYIQDATNSEGYRVLLNADGGVLGIDNIDSGATIYGVASATSVVTNSEGLFTFHTTSGTGVAGVTGTGTQIFQITNDKDGVTFVLDSATGFVKSISGIDKGATISITDLTVADSAQYWTKENLNTDTWNAFREGVWRTDQYLGYIIANSGTTQAYTVYGIESDTNQEHVALTATQIEKRVGTSDGTTFTLNSNVFDSVTQVAFINSRGENIAASDTNGLMFSNFASNTNMGLLLYTSGSSVLEIATVPTNSGSATAITSISEISDTVSLTLGNMLFKAGSEYGVSGTGVAFAVDSSGALVGASEGNAYVGLGTDAVVEFGSDTGVYNIYSDTGLTSFRTQLTVNGDGVVASNTSVFGLNVAAGASVTDTYLGTGDSGLTINGVNLGMYANSTTFTFGAGETGKSDTLSVALGTLGIIGNDSQTLVALANQTTLGLINDSSSLIVNAFSYTGVKAATFAIGLTSGTQLATVSKGTIEEDVASGTSFIFNGNLFTATSAIAAFQVGTDANSNTLLEGSSATGIYNGTDGQHTLYDMGSTTFTMDSGSSVIMTFDESAAFKADYNFQSGTGSFTTSTVFSLSDYYLSGGVSNTDLAKTVYSYTAKEAATLTLSLTGADSATVALTAGIGEREVGSGTAFTFSNIADYTGADALNYTTTGTAFTFSIDSETAKTYGAFGEAWEGSATRTYTAAELGEGSAFTSTTMYRSFNSDTFLPTAGALMTLNIVDGVGSETFTSGSGTFTAAANDTFHFTLDGKTNSYTAVQDVTLGAYFGSADATGTLISASGSGTRIGNAEGDGTWWSFEGLGDSYTMKEGAGLTLTIGGVADGVGFGTETVTAGTGTYQVATDGLFTISQDYLSGTGLLTADSYTYKAVTGGTLTAYIDANSGTQITLGDVVGQRTVDSATGVTFDVASGTIAGLAGATLDSFTFSSTSDTLTFQIDGSSTLAAGTVFAGVGTRAYTLATDGTATTMERTFWENTFMPGDSATMQIEVVGGQGTETFLAGSGTFTAKIGDTFGFIANSDTEGVAGTLQTYTATSAVDLGAYFADASTSAGVLYSANGAGIRFGSGTYVVDALSDSYTMKDDATITLTLGDGIGTEKFTSGTGIFNVSVGSEFSIAQAFLTGTSDTGNVGEVFKYVASSTGATGLTLTLDGTETKISLGDVVGTREVESGTTFVFDPDGTGPLPTYTYTAESTIIYKIAAGDSATGVVFAGTASRVLADGDATSTAMQLTFHSNTFMAAAGSTMMLNIENGVGTETFTSGSATWQAQAVGDTFYFDYNGDSSIQTNEAYKAVSTETALFGIVDGGSVTSLYNAIGAGTRTGSGTYLVEGLGDSYTMKDDATITLTFSDTGKVQVGDAFATEDFTSGTGTLSVSGTQTFSLSDFYLSGGASGTATDSPFVYTTSGTTKLELTLDQVSGTKVETIAITDGFATRSDTLEIGAAFNFDNATYSATTTDFTFFISAESQTTAYGNVFNGAGNREFNAVSDSSLVAPIEYHSDTYKFSGGLINIDIESNSSTFNVGEGSATWQAKATDDAFHFDYDKSGTIEADEEYKANSTDTALYAVVNSESEITGLYSAAGKGNRKTTGTETYVVAGLGDSYTMAAEATKTLTFSDTGEVQVGDVYAQEDFTSGDGSYTAKVADSETFKVSDKWLNTGADTEAIEYTAYGAEDVVLNLKLEDRDSGTITIESGMGTRLAEGEEAETFKFDPGLGETQEYVAEAGSVYYSIEKGATVASGDFFAGVGSREFTSGSTTAKVGTYLGDEYKADSGTVAISVENKTEYTETFVSGSAKWTAEEEGAEFHFVYNDGEKLSTNTYQAAAGTTLYGIVESGSVTGLYNATGAGSRTTSETEVYTIDDLNSESYELEAGATVTLSFSDTGDAFSAKEDYTSGNATKTIDSATGTFTLSEKWFNGSGSSETFIFTATDDGDVELTLTLEGRDSGTIKVTSGKGTRERDIGDTFKFSPVKGATYTYDVTEKASYFIDSNTTVAGGNFYGGKGTRFMAEGESTSAVLSPYFSDTYTPVAGTVSIVVEDDKGTETFVSGSATWKADAEGAVFHFDYNGDGKIQDNEEYTAAEAGGAALYGIVDTDSVTKLYNAIGEGNRITIGTETYTVSDLGDSYTMAEGATVALTFSGTSEAFSTAAVEDFASGTGTLNAESGTTFSISDKWLTGGESEEVFTYTAAEEDGVKLALTLEGKGSGTIKIESGFGIRDAGSGTFVFEDNEYTADSDRVYSITTGAESAEGSFYAGEGTRVFESGTSTVDYLSDTYTVSEGIMSVKVVAGEGSETLVGGTGTYVAEVDGSFHFATDKGVYEYKATEETTLKVSVEGSNTALFEASGAGARDLDSATTFAVSKLGNDEYTFTEGQVQLSIESLDSYSETLSAGIGYMTATGTFTAAFDESGTITDNAYIYTASGEAVLSATLESGSAIAQSFISGAATRAGIEGSDTTFNENGFKYTIQDAANTTFVLNEENASKGAAGSLYNGSGLRDAVEGDTYSVEGGNTYSDLVTGGATFQNGYINGEFGSDTLYNAHATLDFEANSGTFLYKGTEYTAGDSGATMALTAESGTVKELLADGSGIFEGNTSDTTFTYDENTYHVSGTAVLELFAGSDTPVFKSGTGVKDMVASDTFKYTPDGNTYTLTSDEGRLIAEGNGSKADVYFTSGTAINNLTEGQTFNYTLDDASHTYTAAADGVVLGLNGVAKPETAKAEFVGGKGSRTQDDAAGVEFTFEGNKYTSIGDELGLTLELNDSGTAYEYATSGQGSREITEGDFIYESPIDNLTHTYKAASVVLELELVDGQGTETFVSGEATRDMNVGDTFELAPSKFEFDGSETMTFTAIEAGEYRLTAKNTGDGTSDMLFMGYNVDVVNETMLNGVATGTATSPFKYESKVTSEKEKYEGDGVVFGVTVEGGANTATWISGTATMTLDADRTFAYTPDASSEHTYTVETSATFTRTGEDEEVFTEGDAYRLSDESDTYTVVDNLDNEYTVDAGAKIALVVSETKVSEMLGTGSATFTAAVGETFNYEVNGTSHTYTVDADVALQGNVVDNKVDKLFAAEGVGVREFGADEATTTTILGDNYSVESGKFALVLTTEEIGNEKEVFAQGSGTFSTTGVFHVNDYFLGTGTDTEIYEYSALDSNTGVTLGLTVEDGSSTIVIESGMGTREVDTESFTFNDYEYTNAEDVAYAISSTGVAAGYLYNAVGTRTAEDSSGTLVFNEDTYTVDEGATMVLKVTEGVGTEKMTAGTATYVAEVGNVFHFESSTGIQAYTAISETTLQLAFEDSSTQTLSTIDGAGTRAATEDDENLTLEYQNDDYHAVAISSTILFKATGDLSTAEESLVDNKGIVVNNVETSDTFHTNAAGEWYEYTANEDINITLSLSDSVQSFNDVDAIRTASDTTFVYGTREYTSSGDEVVYNLTGSGTADDLNENIFEAEGYRTSSESETFVSNWHNTYDVSSGTYAISIENGAGTETLTGGAGVAEIETGDSFNYGDSATSFIANIEGAKLELTMEGDSQIESLTEGAGFDGSNTYIAASNAKVSIEASNNANLSAVAANADPGKVITFTADTENGLTNADNVFGDIEADFEANGTLKVNGRDFTAVNDEAVMWINNSLNGFIAGEDATIAAEGDFTTDDAPTIANKTIGIASDTDVVVTFDEDSILKLEKLSDGVIVTDTARATKAITDSEGKFVFNDALEQSFNISNDEEVTFKIEDGLVYGIAGIEDGSTFEITDGSWTGTINVTTGNVLKRNDDGSWTDTAVTAESYLVSLDSADSLTVYAVDADGDLNKIDNSAFGSVSGTDINITVEGAVTEKEVYIVNQSNKAINVSGKANLKGIGVTSDTSAVQLTTNNDQFIAGKLLGTDFSANATLGVSNGQFSIGSSGEMAVEAKGATANVAMSANDSVGLVAGTVASNFSINDGEAVTLVLGSDDSDGKGIFAAQLTDNTLSGLTPDGVETGTVVVSTNADSVKFSIKDSAVVVENDNDEDGMTLEIQNDELFGLNNISTDATINASDFAGLELAINGDTDNKVTASTDPIKYNATKEQWIAGDATSIDGATGYFASVNADNKVELYYTTSDTTDTKLTTNIADYEAVFSGLAPEHDGEQPTYDNGLAINSELGSDVKVSIAAGSTGISASMSDESGSKDLILTTANGNYTINGQEVIPSAEVTVNAMGTDAVSANLNANTTIDHGAMSFTAETDTEISFSNDAIVLGDTTKVTNTDSEAEFKVKGTVTFDSIAVVASSIAGVQAISVKDVTANIAPAALTINDKDINVTGGDLAFTIDASSAVPVVSGISGDATLAGELLETAKVLTDSVGTFKIGDSDPFTISDDNEVAFTVKDNVVTAIDSLEGTATGNFSNQVNIDSDHSVLILNDTLVGVTADGTQVTAIDGVGSEDSDVVIANAGGATIVTTDLNGSIYFGDSQHYNVTDTDAKVSFLTSQLNEFVPSVTGVIGLNDGTIAISQDENGLRINDANITLSGVSSDVTIAVANDTISSVLGLEGGVNGLAADVVVNAIDSDVTINSAALQVDESGNTNLTVYAAEGGFDTVTGLNNGAVVTTAKNAHVVTEEEGVFTFVGDSFTISGDDFVTFETDENSKVKNIADFTGTLTSSENQVTVNGAFVGTTNTDASIVSAGEGVSSVLGLADGDSVSVPNGVAVEMRGTSEDDSDTALTVNGKNYWLSTDEDGLVIYAGGEGAETVTGLGAGASLTVGAAGIYNVNGEQLNASVGAVIIGDEEGSAHIYDAHDIDIDDNTSVEEILKKMIGVGADDRYTEKLDAENAARLAEQMAAGDFREANGNIEMTVVNESETAQDLNFAGTSGIKKISLEGGDQNVEFNNAGENIAVIPNSSANKGTEKNVKFGDGGDLAIVEDTDVDNPINITTAKGRDTVITKGRNVRMNLNAGGPATIIPTGGRLLVNGYQPDKGQSFQVNLSNIFKAVKSNIIKFANDVVTMNNGAVIDFSGGASSSDAESDAGARVVNFKNLKGLITKVLYTYDEGDKNIDMSDNHEDMVIKANYTEGSAQRKSGTEIIRTGSGNDTGLGGSGDVFNLGSGYNHLFIDDENRNLSEAGTIIEQTANTGATYGHNFHAGYGDNADVVRIDTNKSSVSYDGTTLKYSTGAAELNLNAITNSSSDLANSADISETSRIGETGKSMKTKVQDINDSSETSKRLEVAQEGTVINVEVQDDVITQYYVGENSGVNLGTYDGSALVDMDNVLGKGSAFGDEQVALKGITKLQGGSSTNTTLIGSATVNNTIVAGVGGGSIWGGGASNDTLYGVGSDLESVKSAATTFFYMNGDGKDLIKDFTFFTEDTKDVADKLNFATSQVADVQISGNNVIVSLNNESDKLTIENAAGKDVRVEYGNLGASQSLTAQIQNTSIDFDGYATYYRATGKNASVIANSTLTSANIWLNNDANNSKNTFVGDIKYLNASNVEGKATLVGNANDNVIIASKDGSTMWGSDQGGNDTLYGGEGADTFIYGKNNNGNDIINNADGSDIVNFSDTNLEDILTADIVNSNKVVVTMKDSKNTLTVNGNITAGTQFKLADGSTWVVDSTREWIKK
ncbi:MAG: hypothetical protein IKZ58_07445 [Selenomonadaceae bacterium]|nr:hypothetical protein [Selenomonadaceae bacterium]